MDWSVSSIKAFIGYAGVYHLNKLFDDLEQRGIISLSLWIIHGPDDKTILSSSPSLVLPKLQQWMNSVFNQDKVIHSFNSSFLSYTNFCYFFYIYNEFPSSQLLEIKKICSLFVLFFLSFFIVNYNITSLFSVSFTYSNTKSQY